MTLEDVRQTFETLGRQDPLWTVITNRRFKRNRWDPGAFFETGREEIRGVMDYLDRLGLKPRRQRALDFGCGVGRLSQTLADSFQHVVGVDIAESMLEAARRYNRHGDRCQYVCNTSNDLKRFADASFDFIYTNITLQHIPPEHSAGYISEFFRLLRADGVVIFQVPCGQSPPDGTWGDRWRRFRWRYLGPLRTRWKKLRGVPVIEMHPVARSRIEQLVGSGNGELVDVVEDTAAGRRYQSLRYCARKAA